MGVQVLINLEHRGALGGDKSTGDGAGIRIQIPDRFFREACAREGFKLPRAGDYAVGMFFLPKEAEASAECIRLIEQQVRAEGAEVVGWRSVPINETVLGETARTSAPRVRQLFVSIPDTHGATLERKLYVLRRLTEKAIQDSDNPALRQFYCCSFSGHTIVYKGLLTATQLPLFFTDLKESAFQSAYAIVHQRYSTNTFPTWSLAQPFRFVAHNGEINTLRGNINRMKARDAIMASDLFGPDLERIRPIIQEEGSDSAIFDNVLELLTLSGRSLPHAMMMMIPEAWGTKFHMSEDKRAFYEYHAAIMEPWDGPAAMAFSDGRYVGAMLDRNGLRPSRYTVTKDDLVVLASESGVLDIPADRILRRGRLSPGRMFVVDLEQKRIVPDNEIKAKICRQKPYRHWVKDNRIELRGLFTPSSIEMDDPEALLEKQLVFGYTEDELNTVLLPMASHGQEAVGSMGDDAPLAVLSNRPKMLFVYFKQLFAQVTNPPIDPFREELVMSLMSFVGRERNLLTETPDHVRRLKLPHPILMPDDLVRVRNSVYPEVKSATLDILFPKNGDDAVLQSALEDLFTEAEKQIRGGVTMLILSDRAMDSNKIPIPSLLACAGLHHHLIRKGLRTEAAIVLETGEAREIMHFALLFGYGANAVCPYVAFSTISHLMATGEIQGPDNAEEAMDLYVTAVKKGLLKTFSRMGISTLRSYCGAQIFEAVGIGPDMINKYFTDTPSRIGGIGLAEIAQDANLRHRRAFPLSGKPEALSFDGVYSVRAGGEKHLWTPEAIFKLQQAVRNNDSKAFAEYAKAINEQSLARVTLRSLLKFKACQPVPLSEVEPAEQIIRRFVASAMSFGSLSKEAHETIAQAMNECGGRSNSGEGGEDPARFKPDDNGVNRCSRVKQVASGRFGVSTEYLVNADELQIKIAQGAKPGEGGQLPGHKVTEDIARVRFTTPGVTLISPPPHHDIYSIEDIAQLIHDLKCVNPKAMISVKLVSEVGVGTVAAGVAKAKADLVLISGGDGGTGASPLTSIKHAGLPWELGLAETHQTLTLNKLRDRIRVQVDGQLRTGRDLAIAALLGAEEFGFGTVLLVTLGCTLLRKCHLNTCAMGVATQDPKLRERFKGKPEHAARFLRFIAEDFREQMAALGFKTVSEMVGRMDRLEPETDLLQPKARTLNLKALLTDFADTASHRCCMSSQEHELEKSLDYEIMRLAPETFEKGKPSRVELPVRNTARSVGALLSGEIVRRFGREGLPEDTLHVHLTGAAGQSLGAFLAPGVTLHVQGEANDYIGKGMSGGRIVVTLPVGANLRSHENVIGGNTCLYGATGGRAYLHGIVGERFAVRNSGAIAVVEGAGDHCCEYMTGGTVVVLGGTGNNFAAGMSGGTAYVYDETQLFDTRCNLDMVDVETVWLESDKKILRNLIEDYERATGSRRARMLLDNWESHLPLFVKVMPVDYRKSLERQAQSVHRDNDTVSATEEVYRG